MPKDKENPNYFANLTKAQKAKQSALIAKSKQEYKKGKVEDRPRVSDTPNKRSKHVRNFENKYGFPITDKARVEETFPDADIDTIFKKGIGAYGSSGSRPNVSAAQWAYARLASVLTGGPSLRIDRNLVGPISLEKIGQRGGVTISKPEFIKEHENLLRILKSGKRSELVKEAADQQEELDKVLKGGQISKDFLQQMAQSAYPGNTKLQIGPYKLQFSTPTLKFYRENKNIVVSIRGTQPSDAADLSADGLAIIGRLRSSSRYTRDLQTLLDFQTKYPKSEYRYIGVAHSLGAAIMDGFIRAGLLRNGLSYNGLVEPQEIRGNPLHYRIYNKNDPLYLAVGKYIPNVEVRTTVDPLWKTILEHYLPFGLSALFKMYDSHRLGTFKGGH